MPVRARLPARVEKARIDASLAIVNIVLLLIFFFLTTGSLVNSGSVELALPETAELPLDMLPKPLLVVGADASMSLDGDPVEPGTLRDRTIDYPVLNIIADRDTTAATVLETIAAEDLIAVQLRLVTMHHNRRDGE